MPGARHCDTPAHGALSRPAPGARAGRRGHFHCCRLSSSSLPRRRPLSSVMMRVKRDRRFDDRKDRLNENGEDKKLRKR